MNRKIKTAQRWAFYFGFRGWNVIRTWFWERFPSIEPIKPLS